MQHKKNEMPNFEIIIIDRCMDIFILNYCILRFALFQGEKYSNRNKLSLLAGFVLVEKIAGKETHIHTTNKKRNDQ